MSGQPRTIGRYEVRREIGRGMMGIVHEAFDPVLGRPIALKTIHLAFAVSPEDRALFEERFFAEARIAARLSHPGIVVVHDFGRDDCSGLLYMALEFLPGRTLAQALKQDGRLPWREALRVMARLADALHHAHVQGVVHRDVKTGNVMILPSGEPKVMDFGIAKLQDAGARLTATGQLFGTPLYMAPEQALGREADARSDLFSLGAIAHESLTGQAAFAGPTLAAIVNNVLRYDPGPPSRLVAGVPAQADYLVARALAKDPAHRYRDGRTLAEDVEDVLAGRPPRHRAAWTSPDPRAVEVPVGNPLARLIDGGGSGTEPDLADMVPLEDAEPLDASAPERGPTGTIVSRTEPPGRSSLASCGRGGRPRAWVRLAAFLVAGAALLPLARGRTPGAPPKPALSPAAERATPPPAPKVPERSGPGRLALDFEHPLKNGTIHVWLDDDLVLEQELDSRVATKIGSLKIRKGSLDRVLEVAPGRHVVRAQVAWEGNRKTASLPGTFRPGATRRLQIRIGLIRKDLSMEWR